MSNHTTKKELAESLANSIYNGTINQTEISKHMASLHELDDHKTNETTQPMPESKKVGIYTLKNIDGVNCYVRDTKYKSEFSYWSKTTDAITEKSAKKRRIVLLGESVARGWFYEPYYSPASVLQEILNLHFSTDVEVVDLAVTSIRSSELLDLCEEALKLSPDTFVIFAGNNWKDNALETMGEKTLYEVYNEIISGKPDYDVIKKYVSTAFSELTEAFFTRLMKITSEKKINVVFVIPEFNLLDFQSSELDKEMFMPNYQTPEWLKTKESGEKILEKGNLKGLSEYAHKLVELHPFHPLGYEWLAKLQLENGNLKEAKTLLQTASDTAMFRALFTTARIFGDLRNAIISSCNKHNIMAVNSTEVFENYLEGKIPGRELYLDYCHLTVKGIEISMIECARAIVKTWTGSDIDSKALNYKITYDPVVLSNAHFFAALHNNLCRQNFEIIDYHCRKAYEYDAAIAHKMSSYVTMAISSAPWKINKESLNFIKNNMLEMLMFQYERHAGINSYMIQSIRNIFEENNIPADFDVQLSEEHLQNSDGVDLLSPKYLTNSLQGMHEFVLKGKGFFSDINLDSEFNFVASAEHDITAELTYRVPGGSNDNSIGVLINDKLHSEFPAHSKWNNCLITIPRADLKKGINTLSLQWPLPALSKEKGNFRFIEDLADAISPALGEIYTLNINEVKV